MAKNRRAAMEIVKEQLNWSECTLKDGTVIRVQPRLRNVHMVTRQGGAHSVSC